MVVQILGSGCASCKKLEKRAAEAVEKLGLDAKVEKVTEMEKIAEAGIVSTPGLIIDGKTVAVGRVPSTKELMEIIGSGQSKQSPAVDKMTQKKIIRIIVPVLIVLTVAGLGLYKNRQKIFLPESTEAQTAFSIPLHLTTVDLDAIANRNLPAIIDFGADACVPCKEMAPVLVSLNAEMQGRASIHFVDVWKNPGAAQGFPVQVIPTQVLINADGSPYVPSEDLAIPFTLYASRNTSEHIFTVHQGGLTEDQMRSILADMGVSG